MYFILVLYQLPHPPPTVPFSFVIPYFGNSNCFEINPELHLFGDLNIDNLHTFPYSYNNSAPIGTSITLTVKYYFNSTGSILSNYPLNGVHIAYPTMPPTYTFVGSKTYDFVVK